MAAIPVLFIEETRSVEEIRRTCRAPGKILESCAAEIDWIEEG